MKNADDFCWSTDEENFSLDFCTALDLTLGDIPEGESGVGRIMWYGTRLKIDIKNLINVDDLIDMMHDRAYDICGEFAEDFPDVSKESIKKLQNSLNRWCKKYIDINFYSVGDVKEYSITEQDVLDYES